MRKLWAAFVMVRFLRVNVWRSLVDLAVASFEEMVGFEP